MLAERRLRSTDTTSPHLACTHVPPQCFPQSLRELSLRKLSLRETQKILLSIRNISIYAETTAPHSRVLLLLVHSCCHRCS